MYLYEPQAASNRRGVYQGREHPSLIKTKGAHLACDNDIYRMTGIPTAPGRTAKA